MQRKETDGKEVRNRRLWRFLIAAVVAVTILLIPKGFQAEARTITTDDIDSKSKWHWESKGGERFLDQYKRLVNTATGKSVEKGWHLVDDYWYYFENGGYVFDEFHGGYAIGGPGDGLYYTDSEDHSISFSVKYKWVKSGNRWRYMIEKSQEDFDDHLVGTYARIDGKVYWFDEGGYTLPTGWQMNGWGDWVFVNTDGSVRTGWQKISGKWYFFDYYNGCMAMTAKDTSPIGVSRRDFHAFDGNGVWIEKSGWQLTGMDEWVYIDSKGKCCTGWKQIKGKYYYLDPYHGGAMARSFGGNDTESPEYCYVDGYYIDENGVCRQGGYGWHANANGFWFGKGSYYERGGFALINGGWAQFDVNGYCMNYDDVRNNKYYNYENAVG